jgi:hypothetical protein
MTKVTSRWCAAVHIANRTTCPLNDPLPIVEALRYTPTRVWGPRFTPEQVCKPRRGM